MRCLSRRKYAISAATCHGRSCLAIVGITLIYLAVNAAYLHALGFDAAQQSATPAADAMEKVWGEWGGRAIGILVMLSALGAINGMILTGHAGLRDVGRGLSGVWLAGAVESAGWRRRCMRSRFRRSWLCSDSAGGNGRRAIAV